MGREQVIFEEEKSLVAGVKGRGVEAWGVRLAGYQVLNYAVFTIYSKSNGKTLVVFMQDQDKIGFRNILIKLPLVLVVPAGGCRWLRCSPT